MPRVSVVMPVYNAAEYLKDAIESILLQTYQDFEFLIINDGSIDDSNVIIDFYQDVRIRKITLPTNQGIIYALNYGIELAQGEYIVRMDADDIAYNSRIEKQVQYMDQFLDIGVSGTGVEYFGKRNGVVLAKTNHGDIIWSMLYGSPFYHPTIIIRKRILIDNGIFYPKEFPHAEDYALWYKLMEITRFGNISEPLLKYRYVGTSVSSRHSQIQKRMAKLLQVKIFSKLGAEEINENDLELLNGEKRVDIKRINALFQKLTKLHGQYSKQEFHQQVIMTVKKLINKNGTDWKSVWWLVKKSIPYDPGYLKLALYSLSRNLFKL